MATIAVISLSTPIFLTVILPIAILYYFVQRFYVSSFILKKSWPSSANELHIQK